MNTPDVRPMRPLLFGDAPALADVTFTNSATSNAPIWAMLAWWNRPLIWNWCGNGDLEDDADGWSSAGAIGVTGACTSIARDTTAARCKYGTANLSIVCPATANTGAIFFMPQRFFAGRQYGALAWVSSAAGVTTVRCRLGISGDIASSNATALTTTPTLHGAYWSPTIDRDGAYVAAEITAATGTTFSVDAVVVFEAKPTTCQLTQAAAATMTVDAVPDDWPTPPFLMATKLDAGGPPMELMRVTAISGNVLSIDRGMEGTTAAIIASASVIAPVPELRPHFEGKGAPPPFGVIEAEGDDSGQRNTWAITADGAARMGNLLKATAIGSSGQALATYLVDPNLLVPDDFTQSEIAVEVWGRYWIGGLTNPTCVVTATPETATAVTGTISSSFGSIRYTDEFGTTGKPLILPSSSNVYRFAKFGTIRLPLDRTRPLRQRIGVRMAWTAASSGQIGLDYLVLVPATQRACSPTARANNSGYPKFISGNNETTKIVKSDLSAQVGATPFALSTDHGIGGSLIELPYGHVDFLVKLSSLIPDDASSDTTSETDPGVSTAVHFGLTPRGSLSRGT